MNTLFDLILFVLTHWLLITGIWICSGLIGYLIRVLPGEEHHERLIEHSRFLSHSDNPEFWELLFLIFLGPLGLIKTAWNWIFQK